MAVASPPAPGDPPSSVRRRRRSRMRRLRYRAGLAVLGLAIVGLGFAAGTLLGFVSNLHDVVLPRTPSTEPPGVQNTVRAIHARADLVPGGAVRPVFRYSIIAGGAYSAEEAALAAQADPVVAGHYRDLVLPAMHVRRLEAARGAYVSYRVADRVYWTKNRVLVHAGESLLTDGEQMVRARCGNRISDLPQMPVLPEEPPLEETLVMPYDGDTVFPPPPLLASRDLPVTVVPDVPGRPSPEAYNSPPPVPPVVPPPNPPPPVVPEPTSVLLVGTGLGFAALRWLRRGRH